MSDKHNFLHTLFNIQDIDCIIENILDVVGDIPETVFVEDAVCHPHDVLVLDGTVALRADLDHVGHRDT